MSVTERKMGVGRWQVNLSPDTPRTIMETIRLENPGVGLGSLVISSTHIDPTQYSDADMLGLARYTGVYRSQSEQFTLGGPGVEFWLGDESGKGRSFGTFIGSGNFAYWMNTGILSNAPWLSAGSITNVATVFAKTYTRGVLREILDEVMAVYNAEWRLNPDFSLDAGPVGSLFVNDPHAVIVRREGDGGRDFNIRGIVGDMQIETDLEDWARRIVFFYGDPASHSAVIRDAGVTDINVPYRAPDGSHAWIDQTEENFGDIDGQQVALADAAWLPNRFYRSELRVSSSEYDIGTDIRVGDQAWVFDPERGLYDMNNVLAYRGQTINPVKVQTLGQTWAVRNGMGVYLRLFRYNGFSAWDPFWVDLTPYVMWESGDTELEIGAIPRGSR